eukprot:scaffold9834_cov105-Isochrysis_galbana.AAC.6
MAEASDDASTDASTDASLDPSLDASHAGSRNKRADASHDTSKSASGAHSAPTAPPRADGLVRGSCQDAEAPRDVSQLAPVAFPHGPATVPATAPVAPARSCDAHAGGRPDAPPPHPRLGDKGGTGSRLKSTLTPAGDPPHASAARLRSLERASAAAERVIGGARTGGVGCSDVSHGCGHRTWTQYRRGQHNLPCVLRAFRRPSRLRHRPCSPSPFIDGRRLQGRRGGELQRRRDRVVRSDGKPHEEGGGRESGCAGAIRRGRRAEATPPRAAAPSASAPALAAGATQPSGARMSAGRATGTPVGRGSAQRTASGGRDPALQCRAAAPCCHRIRQRCCGGAQQRVSKQVGLLAARGNLPNLKADGLSLQKGAELRVGERGRHTQRALVSEADTIPAARGGSLARQRSNHPAALPPVVNVDPPKTVAQAAAQSRPVADLRQQSPEIARARHAHHKAGPPRPGGYGEAAPCQAGSSAAEDPNCRRRASGQAQDPLTNCHPGWHRSLYNRRQCHRPPPLATAQYRPLRPWPPLVRATPFPSRAGAKLTQNEHRGRHPGRLRDAGAPPRSRASEHENRTGTAQAADRQSPSAPTPTRSLRLSHLGPPAASFGASAWRLRRAWRLKRAAVPATAGSRASLRHRHGCPLRRLHSPRRSYPRTCPGVRAIRAPPPAAWRRPSGALRMLHAALQCPGSPSPQPAPTRGRRKGCKPGASHRSRGWRTAGSRSRRGGRLGTAGGRPGLHAALPTRSPTPRERARWASPSGPI